MMVRGSASAGWTLAIVSSAAFGITGSFATPLIDSGWSPGAAVTARVTLAAIILAGPTIWALRGRWGLVTRNIGLVLGYGLVAVAACQLFFFSALATLDVGVALLLEYLGIIMVVLWLWLRHGQRPRSLTVAGAMCAMVGLALVLNLVGGGVRLDVVGVLWGLAAAVGLATHFVLSARPADGLPPLALAACGLTVAAVVLWIAGALGIMPLRATWGTVVIADADIPWWIPIIGVALISAAIAYVTAIGAVRILGSKLASFVGLAEVLFAIVFAWVLLGQMPGWVQLGGGALIVGGVVLVRADELRGRIGLPDRALPNPEPAPPTAEPPNALNDPLHEGATSNSLQFRGSPTHHT